MNHGSAIPVLMYHSVGNKIPDWQWSFLTLPYSVFEDHLKWLKKTQYQTVDLYQLHEHVSGKVLLPPRSVVLTFDDGYLDNWTFAVPLLRKYGFKATVFINPEFVDTRDIIRPTLEDVWSDRFEEDQLDVRGFMSWQELRQISDSGIFSVQSHLMTHTWYPVSDEVVDFHHPGDAYYWMDWNASPKDKPFYLQYPGKSQMLFGYPVYKHDKSARAKRFFPDARESEYLIQYVASRGGAKFFQSSRWKDHLQDVLIEFRDGRSLEGRYETKKERLDRLEYELVESKRLIEKNTGSSVDFLCWPGGGYNQEATDLTSGFYRSMTLGSKDRSNIMNRPGDDPKKIKRLGIPFIEQGGRLFYLKGRYLIKFLDEYRSIKMARQSRQAMKLFYYIAAKLKLDGLVKSPISALRCILRRCGVR